jgi:hypothetical protein
MSQEFQTFCKDYNIQHKPSSPHYQRSNGEAERAVKTVKSLWRKASDKCLALLDYRTTPLEGVNLSPAQLLMGRRPRNTLPTAKSLLIPSSYNRQEVKRRLDFEKTRQKYYHDERSGAELPPLKPGDHVRMSPMPESKVWQPGVVLQHHETPKSYIVQSGQRVLRRNRRHLRTSTATAGQRSGQPEVSISETHEPSVSTPSVSTPSVSTPSVSTPRSNTLSVSTPRDNAPVSSVPVSSPPVRSPEVPTETRVTRTGRTVRPPKRLDI